MSTDYFYSDSNKIEPGIEIVILSEGGAFAAVVEGPAVLLWAQIQLP